VFLTPDAPRAARGSLPAAFGDRFFAILTLHRRFAPWHCGQTLFQRAPLKNFLVALGDIRLIH
jgi:hypothetical protein